MVRLLTGRATPELNFLDLWSVVLEDTAPTFNRQSSERRQCDLMPKQMLRHTDTRVYKEVYMIGKL